MSEQPVDEKYLLSRTAELLEPLALEVRFNCDFHPEAVAETTCVRCGRGLCAECAAGAMPDFICRTCRSEAVKKKIFQYSFRSLRWPVLWVLLCALIAGIAYWQGVGNPDVAELTRRDAKAPWYEQSLGKLYLAKASRENQRAAALRELKRPDEAMVWSGRAALSFARGADYWKSAPGGPLMRIGEAMSLAYAGEPAAALKLMQELKLSDDVPAYPGYLYKCGQICELGGEKEKALDYYRRSLESAEKRAESGRDFDSLLTLLSSSKPESKLLASIQQICGVNLKYADLCEKLEPYHIVPQRRSGVRPEPVKQPLKKSSEADFTVEVLNQEKR